VQYGDCRFVVLGNCKGIGCSDTMLVCEIFCICAKNSMCDGVAYGHFGVRKEGPAGYIVARMLYWRW